MQTAYLPIGAVVVLSFLAARAGAQIDSNAYVKLYFGPVSNGCSFVVNCYDGSEQGSAFTLKTVFDSTIRLRDTNRFLGNGLTSFLINFNIDLAKNQVLNLTIQNANRYYYLDAEDGCEGGVNYTFDSIPFNYSNGSLKIIPSQYFGRSYTWAFFQYGV